MHSSSVKPSGFIIRRLNGADAHEYRELRLEGLRDHPEAFGASLEDEEANPPGWFADRLDRNAVFGGFSDGEALKGVAGLAIPAASKLRHKGLLWGMFVRPDARGSGLAAALVTRVVEHARDLVEEVKLTVGATNAAAIKVYTRAGFVQFASERDALRVGGQSHDELFLALRLRRLG